MTAPQFDTGASGGLGVIGTDAGAILAQAAVEAAAPVTEEAVLAELWVRMAYSPAVANQYCMLAQSYKLRQNMGVMGRLEKLIGAFSLKELTNRMNINLGG